MLKKIMNRSEDLTYKNVNEICSKYAAIAYPKVRIADVLKIKKSGISKVLIESQMTGNNFPIPIFEVAEDIAIIHLYDTLSNILKGDMNKAVHPNDINQAIHNKKSSYGSPISGASCGNMRIKY